jgi:hypothetical protein
MPCASGTEVTVSRCNNLSCDPANLTVVGSVRVGASGSFELVLRFREVRGARLLVAVLFVEEAPEALSLGVQQSPYRVMVFGPIVAGGRVSGVSADPSSEASLRSSPRWACRTTPTATSPPPSTPCARPTSRLRLPG